jgi:nicotinamidase-related amidase
MKPALLVIDMQKEYYKKLKDSQASMEDAALYINYFVDLFHKKGFPVINVLHQDLRFGFSEGHEDFEFIEQLKVHETDSRIIKSFGNAFKQTDLDAILKEKGVDTVFLCGLAGEYCVHATFYGADGCGYSAFYVYPAVVYANKEYENVISKIVDGIGVKAFLNMIELL